MKVGCMIWRIGSILDIYDQIHWVKTHGFEEVSFWTISGNSGVWQGFDAERANEDSISKLKKALAGISEVDLHSGIELNSKDENTQRATLQKLIPTFELAAAVDASVITIHPDPVIAGFSGKARGDGIAKALNEINTIAEKYGVLVGIETAGKEMDQDISLLSNLDLPGVGITIDTGHIQSQKPEMLEYYGSWGKIMESHGKKIFHVHIHDYDGQFDHIAIGKGIIKFHDIIRALCNIQFTGNLCLEINPDRETPETIYECKNLIEEMISIYRHNVINCY